MSDTPRMNAAAKAVGSLACQWKTGTIDAVQFERAAQSEFDKLAAFERENAKLRADGELVDYLCKLHGCDRKMVLHWCEFAARKSL